MSGAHESRLLALEKRMEEMARQLTTVKVHGQELELQLQASLASTHNGSFLWRIPDVSRRRRDAVEERVTSIYSPPFYTARSALICFFCSIFIISVHTSETCDEEILKCPDEEILKCPDEEILKCPR